MVHVFVASRANWAAAAAAAGWYSLAVQSRMIRKPQVEQRRLGEAFGYPSCCVDFFLRNNDWPRLNTVAEIARESRTLCWETNCLTKHTPFSAIFHLPCAFDCPATREQSRGVLSAMRKLDVGYAEQIERFMRQTFWC